MYHYNTQVKVVSNSSVTCGPLSDDCHYELLHAGLPAASPNKVTQLHWFINIVAMTHAIDFIDCDIGKNARSLCGIYRTMFIHA